MAEARMAEPGSVVKKSPRRDSAPSVYYRRPAGAFPAIVNVVDGSYAGVFYAPYITVTPYVNYTFNGYINGVAENYDFGWGVKYYNSDSESNESTTVTGQNLVWKWGIESDNEAPVFYAIYGTDTLSWQSRGYQMSGDSIVAVYPSYIFSAPRVNGLWEGCELLKSSKTFCYGGRNGDQPYPMNYFPGALPYGGNNDGWWFGKNAGCKDDSGQTYRIDGIAQAFERPTVPYMLKQVVVDCSHLTVTGNVTMTCKVYKLDEIPAYMDDDEAILPEEPGELIAMGRANLTPQTADETGDLIFFTLYGEEDGLEYDIAPTIDCAILVVIDGYNEPEMANLKDFSALISTDYHVDEGFGELAYLKFGEIDQEGNIDYVWKGLNNFFGGDYSEMKTGFTIFITTENQFLTFRYDEENGQYHFPVEGGELVKQFGDITCYGIDFFASIPCDEGDWYVHDDGCDIPDWLHVNLADGEWNWDNDIPTGVVTASVTADPLPTGEKYREAVVRFEIPGAYLDYKFTQGEDNPAYLRGDVNGDEIVSIKDVTSLIDYLLSDDASSIILSNADLDANGIVNIADVTCLIDYLLSGSWPDDPVTPPDTHEWVDLGLPSGTLWATCNVGANSPEEYGDYFAWGETEPKEVYSSQTYKWCNGSDSTLTKYCTRSSYGYNGFTDGKTELDPSDDAATANWGSGARMPTLEQIKELENSCTWKWTTRNGVNGELVTGPNGKTIFLPATGFRWDSSLSFVGSTGDYWSRTLGYYGPHYAYYLGFGSDVAWSTASRCVGQSVRAVRVTEEPLQLSETEVSFEVGESKAIDILNGSGSYSVEGGVGCVTTDVVGNQLILTGVAAGSDNVIVTDAATHATATIAVTVTAPDTIPTRVFTVNGVSFTMVEVEGGTFTMGATAEQGDDAKEDEYPPHQVTLSNYAIGQTEVTQELWKAVMGDNPSSYSWLDDLNRPVDMIDACYYEFIDSLNKLTGWRFRLPTEAEWEFAARGGNRSRGYKYSGSDNLDEVAWYNCSSYEALPVATKAPNELGLYDMSGNVEELCSDFYGEYSSESQTNPTGSAPGTFPVQVFRGGHLNSIDIDCRVTHRDKQSPQWTSPYGGFRLAYYIDPFPEIQLSETDVEIEVGETKTVSILLGSGNFSVHDKLSVEYHNDFLDASVNGDLLILTGVSAGFSKLYVGDNVTGKYCICSVTVTNPEPIQIEHEWVDLGLPSGTLWATCNVGASSPEDYGDYFAWGETEPKDYYDWSTYKWCEASYNTMTKYCTDSYSSYGYNGFVDNKTELDLEDDAAYVNWGSEWCMPTYDQQTELRENCTWTWMTQNGVNGYLVIGTNGNSLFLPAAGVRDESLLNSVGSNGFYFSRTLGYYNPDGVYSLFFDSGLVNWGYHGRDYGFSIRAVRVSQN
ncbi:MAG: SUMF1/EgtB/PvdO family nonheme iron enzyme [Bacteroidales bacterium]|nr:SUMF1/EgtB/PvdO family nonheme iron enzyme [Bacteroidales bacterium]